MFKCKFLKINSNKIKWNLIKNVAKLSVVHGIKNDNLA